MELKIKYQYTYFIKPFLIKETKYSKYILNLLNNNKCKLKIFEKERDLNLYSYFIENIREYFFPTFSFDKNKIRDLENMQNGEKAELLSKLHCNIFEYQLDKKIQGKINVEDGIFFNIDKIEIICLVTGICFLIIKTNIEDTTKFSDVLNFNYKFKDINSKLNKLKDYNNIKIQTETFENMEELSDFIDEIIGINTNIAELNDVDLYNKRFFVYTYSCIDQDNWNNEEDFINIENEFIKFTNVLSNNSTLDFNAKELQDTIQIMEQFKYAKFGFTKQSASLITSSIDINNYTKLLFDFENEYLYTLIIRLYQRIYLKKLQNDINNNKDIETIMNKFYKFTKEIWTNEITNSLTGTMYFNKWKKIFELQNLYNEIKNKYEIMYKEFNVDKNVKVNKFILISLLVSLILNVVNFATLIKFINQ